MDNMDFDAVKRQMSKAAGFSEHCLANDLGRIIHLVWPSIFSIAADAHPYLLLSKFYHLKRPVTIHYCPPGVDVIMAPYRFPLNLLDSSSKNAGLSKSGAALLRVQDMQSSTDEIMESIPNTQLLSWVTKICDWQVLHNKWDKLDVGVAVQSLFSSELNDGAPGSLFYTIVGLPWFQTYRKSWGCEFTHWQAVAYTSSTGVFAYAARQLCSILPHNILAELETEALCPVEIADSGTCDVVLIRACVAALWTFSTDYIGAHSVSTYNSATALDRLYYFVFLLQTLDGRLRLHLLDMRSKGLVWSVLPECLHNAFKYLK